jgi:hypothetical protein
MRKITGLADEKSSCPPDEGVAVEILLMVWMTRPKGIPDSLKPIKTDRSALLRQP